MRITTLAQRKDLQPREAKQPRKLNNIIEIKYNRDHILHAL